MGHHLEDLDNSENKYPNEKKKHEVKRIIHKQKVFAERNPDQRILL